ncbi:MAG: hypothetical protein GY778_26425, partial [bacterium]|nr:hypothetical protein [bacterium]
AARHEFGRYPWVRIENTSRRRYHQAECLAHVLGRTGAVDAARMRDDPYRDDPQRRYRGNEKHGIAGVEWTAEDILRGRRGRLRHDRAGQVVEDLAPQRGGDVRLTIRYDLQARLYDLLASELPELPYSSGGSIVVLDVASRDVLALVSYPGYDPNRFRVADYYDRLRSEVVRMPLWFRAVAKRYPPGSIVKPLTCLAGLSTGKIGLDTRLDCQGHLFPEAPEAPTSRCWMVSGTGQRKVHGRLDVVGALEGSCNVFMYRTGIEVGVDTLCYFFHRVGFGEPSGIGLREETRGINPTPSWFNKQPNSRVMPGHARLFAIGQGEVAVTAVQAANLMATYAAGTYRHVSLIQGHADPREWELPVTSAHWRAIRQGLYAVVNSPFGTAAKHARFEHPRYALAGKTGSATTKPRPISYRIAYRDEQGRKMLTTLPAADRRQALDHFKAKHPKVELESGAVTIQDRWPLDEVPAGGGNHAHAWFAGYLQPIDGAGRPMLDVTPRIAFAVLVEYGGSGGRVSGPIGRQVAGILLDTLGDELNPDHRPEFLDAAATLTGARP